MEYTKENIEQALSESKMVAEDKEGVMTTLINRLGTVPCGVVHFRPNSEGCTARMKVANDTYVDGVLRARITTFSGGHKILAFVNAINLQSLDHPGKWVLSGEGTIEWVYPMGKTEDVGESVRRAVYLATKELVFRGFEVFDIDTLIDAQGDIKADMKEYFRVHMDVYEDFHGISADILDVMSIASKRPMGGNERDGGLIMINLVEKRLKESLEGNPWIRPTVDRTVEWLGQLRAEFDKEAAP